MWKGYKRELKHEDLYATPEESRSQELHKRFNRLVWLGICKSLTITVCSSHMHACSCGCIAIVLCLAQLTVSTSFSTEIMPFKEKIMLKHLYCTYQGDLAKNFFAFLQHLHFQMTFMVHFLRTT